MTIRLFSKSIYNPIKIVYPFLIFLGTICTTTSFGQPCNRATFRTVDGTCNNLSKNQWGAAKNPLVRELSALYAPTDPYNDLIDTRPNPRDISNAIFAQKTSLENHADLSSFVFTWGQFIDHDISISLGGQEQANIPLPEDEPAFSIDLSFRRSAIEPGSGIFSPRVQTNEITSWIDASQVYGSSEERTDWLRSGVDGKLKVSPGNLLPYNTINGASTGTIDPTAPEMDNPVGTPGTHFVAGDIRASEQPGLTTLHTIFVREHNRICDELKKNGVKGDEVLFQRARKQVGALIQSITYNEFLPALGIELAPYLGYDPTVQPDIMTEFSTAAFRIGHTMVTDQLLLLNDDCTPVRDPISLEQAFFNNSWIAELGIEPFLKGLSLQSQQETDAKIIDGLRNFLFNIPGLPGGMGMDLVALNVQRGRDHGLQDYNTIRSHFTGIPALTFDQISDDPAVWEPMAKVYKNDITNIDPWIGMLCEDYYENSVVGMTMYQIIKLQFERLREGDFFFYQNDPFYDNKQRLTIGSTKLSDIIRRNTSLTSLQEDIFKVDKTFCSQSSGNTTLTCGDSKIVYGNGTITMSGKTDKSYHFQVFDKSWQTVFSCGWQCGFSQKVTDLSPGVYRVIIYDERWARVCFEEINVTGDESPIDEDGDGVPAAVDCNDLDANLTFEGAACEDGDPTTFNDRVTKDCACLGEKNSIGTEVITCNGISISYGNGAISIAGIPNQDYKFKVERVHPGWESLLNCVAKDCGATPNFQNLSAGTYRVRIWSSDWKPLCNEQIELKSSFHRDVDNKIVSFNSTSDTHYSSSLFPNPAHTSVQLTLPEFLGETGYLMLYNNLGQAVQRQELRTITKEPILLDLQSLQSGIYIVRATIKDKETVQHKLVIKR